MTCLADTSEDGGTFGDPAAVRGEQAHDIFRGDDAWLLRADIVRPDRNPSMPGPLSVKAAAREKIDKRWSRNVQEFV